MILGFFTFVVVFFAEVFFVGTYSLLDMITVATLVVSVYNIIMLLLPEKMA